MRRGRRFPCARTDPTRNESNSSALTSNLPIDCSCGSEQERHIFSLLSDLTFRVTFPTLSVSRLLAISSSPVCSEPKIFYRRRLPHYQPPSETYFITFPLAGSLPNHVILDMKNWRQGIKDKASAALIERERRDTSLYKILQSLKAFTARKCNARFLIIGLPLLHSR